MLNVIAVIGRLVASPELKKTPNGVSTTTFTIACDRSYVKAGQERQTDFFEVVAWRGTAEFVCKYFQKVQLIAVDGSLQTRSYEDKNGNKRKVYEIVATNVHFAEGKKKSLDIAPSGENAEPYKTGSADDFAVIDDSEILPF